MSMKNHSDTSLADLVRNIFTAWGMVLLVVSAPATRPTSIIESIERINNRPD